MSFTPLGPISYDQPPPDSYCCEQCHATGVKLWRLYNTFLESQKLLCANCAEVDQDKQPKEYKPGLGDQIGWMIPAVPTEDGETFWGYTSVPQPGCDWWHRLPDRPIAEALSGQNQGDNRGPGDPGGV